MTELPRSWRIAAEGAARKREALGAVVRGKVMDALHHASVPLPLASIAGLAGVSYFRARRALETLRAMRAVIASGPANNRRFALAASGQGNLTGGHASESAAEALAGVPTSAVRHGSAAA